MKIKDLTAKLLTFDPEMDVIIYIPIANEYPMALEDNKTKVYEDYYEPNDGYIINTELLEQFNDPVPESAKMTAIIELDL